MHEAGDEESQPGFHDPLFLPIFTSRPAANHLLANIIEMRSLPEQRALELLRAATVVLPEGQSWQTGVGVDALPPADHAPMAHSSQLGPPKPGRQTAGDSFGAKDFHIWRGGVWGHPHTMPLALVQVKAGRAESVADGDGVDMHGNHPVLGEGSWRSPPGDPHKPPFSSQQAWASGPRSLSLKATTPRSHACLTLSPALGSAGRQCAHLSRPSPWWPRCQWWWCRWGSWRMSCLTDTGRWGMSW